MITYEDVYKNTKEFKVLYIEDDELSRKETNELFEYFFYRVDLASDGAEGFQKYIDFFKKNSYYYDLIITDINMPNMDGIDLLKQILDRNPSQNIVVVSAYDEASYLIELINVGVKNFLLKPIDYDKILKIFYYIGNTSKNIDKISKDSDNIDISIIQLNDTCSWDKNLTQLTCNKEVIQLTKMEIMFLKLLIKNGTKISTNEEILDTLWEDDDISVAKNITPILSRFRKKIPHDMIETAYGLGYRLSTK